MLLLLVLANTYFKATKTCLENVSRWLQEGASVYCVEQTLSLVLGSVCMETTSLLIVLDTR